jgi:hypothetical protein
VLRAVLLFLAATAWITVIQRIRAVRRATEGQALPEPSASTRRDFVAAGA